MVALAFHPQKWIHVRILTDFKNCETQKRKVDVLLIATSKFNNNNDMSPTVLSSRPGTNKLPTQSQSKGQTATGLKLPIRKQARPSTAGARIGWKKLKLKMSQGHKETQSASNNGTKPEPKMPKMPSVKVCTHDLDIYRTHLLV